MKVVYPICCGIDVHKRFLIATIITTKKDLLTPIYQKKRFSTFNNQILALKKWLVKNNCFDVCMESTGKYWIPVFNLLEDQMNVVVANPKWVRAVKGNKDDVKDSKWIAELFRMGLVRNSFIPEKPIRDLREFTRYRVRLVSQRSSEKNRLQNVFTVGNVAMDAVVSDMFGKSSKKVREYLISTDQFDPDYCLSLLHGRMKPKGQELIESIEGYSFSESQVIRIRLIEEHITYLNHTIELIDKTLDRMVEAYEPAIRLLCTIPGIKRASAIQIISEIGTDMSQFQTAKQLTCWAGLAPSSNESAGKKKSVRISRAGVYLKPTLVQCAHAAVKATKESPYYRIKYQKLSKRRGKKRSIIAISRMMLTAIYHMISTGEVWNPVDIDQVDMSEHVINKRKELAITAAKNLLIKEGLIPNDFQTVLGIVQKE